MIEDILILHRQFGLVFEDSVLHVSRVAHAGAHDAGGVRSAAAAGRPTCVYGTRTLSHTHISSW